MASESPTADYYLSAGCAVSSLVFIQSEKGDYLLAGLTTGELRVFECSSWEHLEIIDVFLKGFLWLEALDKTTLVCQGRFESLKIISFVGGITEQNISSKTTCSVTQDDDNIKNSIRDGLKICQPLILSERTESEKESDNFDEGDSRKSNLLVEQASFLVSHEGFCRGFVLPEEKLIFAPSSSCSLMVVKSLQQFIRPVASLNPETVYKDAKFGTLMCCTKASCGKVLAGYENSDVILWDWTNSTAITRVNLSQCGTLMSIASSLDNNYLVAVGAEDKVVVAKIKEDFTIEILKEREITNPGVGVARIRPDQRILLTGGWDSRIRIFSWKKPERCKPLAVLQFHCQAVECFAFTSLPIRSGRIRKNLFAAGSKDGKISLWSIYN